MSELATIFFTSVGRGNDMVNSGSLMPILFLKSSQPLPLTFTRTSPGKLVRGINFSCAIIEPQGKTNIGRIVFIKRIEQPKNSSRNKTQSHCLPVGAIKLKKVDKDFYKVHDATNFNSDKKIASP
jgi:hypothetical protein